MTSSSPQSILRNLTRTRRRLQAIVALPRIAYGDLRENWLGQVLPVRPSVVNLLVNDICNSRCTMCRIWQRKRDREMTAAELAEILRDPLFNSVRYIGVSGGEPTLRNDLPDLFRAIVGKEPRIRATGIITNAVKPRMVIDAILASAGVCRQAGIPLGVMVSLDGIGDIHDRNRGIQGNFQSALHVIQYLRDNTDVSLSIGCTITKTNVWHVDEVLDFCRSERVYARFRIAEFINRLYNAGQTADIRNFTEDEAYHLGLFFAKLEYQYEPSHLIRRTYRNIREMLLEGKPRSIKCAWQSTGVTLDSRGRLMYCAPRSPDLGSALHESALQLYTKNIHKRRAIIGRDCANCIHDYHAEPTLPECWSWTRDRIWRARLSLDMALLVTRGAKAKGTVGSSPRLVRRVLVLGWYGTETAGDKAILAEIIHRIQGKHPGCVTTLASMYPYVSRRTVRELGYPQVEVIPTYSSTFWDHAAAADEVVMGGGPLMHIEELGVVLRAFHRAKRAGRRTRIAGCGIGPLDRGDRYEEAVRRILNLADVIELRDSRSARWAEIATGRRDIVNSGDPAVDFVRRWAADHPWEHRIPYLNLYLRDWTDEYRGHLDQHQFVDTKRRFETRLSEWIHNLCARLQLRPRLIPMHHFCLGNDDRDFNRRFARSHLFDLEPVVEHRPLSVQEVLYSMAEAELNVCMRFHSVLFADTLKVPFIAIDYTNGGKIRGYLADHDMLDRLVTLQALADGRLPSVDEVLAALSGCIGKATGPLRNNG